jgi:hypothetical protein
MKEAEVLGCRGVALTAEARARNSSNEAGAEVAKKIAGNCVLVWLDEKVVGTETKSQVLALLS